MNKDIFVKCLLSEKIKLAPSKINKHFKESILNDLKAKVEGICTKHGYIRNDSVEIHSIQSGQVEMASLTGNVVVDVKFYTDVCNPTIGNVIKCKVTNINKFGILAEVKPILEVIIAKNSVNIKSDVDLNTIQVGQDVYVEVVGKKYELMDKRISIIGRIVVSPQSSKYKKSIKNLATIASLVELEDENNEGDVEVTNTEGLEDNNDSDDDTSENEKEESEQDSEIDDDEDFDDDDISDDESKPIKKIGGAEFFESDEENFDMFEGGDELSDNEDYSGNESDDY